MRLNLGVRCALEMTAIRILYALSAAALLAGCGMMAEYEDASSEPDYRPLIGKEVLTTADLLLHAVALDLGNKQIDLCSITEQPGFDGPEVIARSALPSGTSLHILSVRRCTNCLSERRIELIVSSQATAMCGRAPVKINHSLLGTSIQLAPDPTGAHLTMRSSRNCIATPSTWQKKLAMWPATRCNSA
jgi:hypothetical protein